MLTQPVKDKQGKKPFFSVFLKKTAFKSDTLAVESKKPVPVLEPVRKPDDFKNFGTLVYETSHQLSPFIAPTVKTTENYRFFLIDSQGEKALLKETFDMLAFLAELKRQETFEVDYYRRFAQAFQVRLGVKASSALVSNSGFNSENVHYGALSKRISWAPEASKELLQDLAGRNSFITFVYGAENIVKSFRVCDIVEVHDDYFIGKFGELYRSYSYASMSSLNYFDCSPQAEVYELKLSFFFEESSRKLKEYNKVELWRLDQLPKIDYANYVRAENDGVGI